MVSEQSIGQQTAASQRPINRVTPLPLILSTAAFIGVAELLTLILNPLAGSLGYASLIAGLGMYLGLTDPAARPATPRNVPLALLAIAVVRLISLALPVGTISPVIWIAVAGVAGLVAIGTLIWSGSISARTMGLRWRFTWLDIIVLPLGVPLGYAGHVLVEPTPLVESVNIGRIVFYCAVLIVCSALLEETLFRGILQPALAEPLGSQAVFLTTVLYALIYTGSRSPYGVLLALIAGGLFGLARYRSGSLWGPVGGHAVMTTLMLVILPASV